MIYHNITEVEIFFFSLVEKKLFITIVYCIYKNYLTLERLFLLKLNNNNSQLHICT